MLPRGWVCASTSCRATTVVALSNRALTTSADVVAIGRVAGHETRRGGRVVLTDDMRLAGRQRRQ